MRKTTSLFIAIIFFFLITGCFSPAKSIDKLWFYTYSSNVARTDTTLTPASFINLQSDGTYTRDFGNFDYGKWKMQDKKLHLINNEQKTFVIDLFYISANEIQLHLENDPDAEFESQPGSFSSDNENPFSKENNLWRIHATKKETDEEISNRLLNHFKFWEKYFRWALNNELSTVDVRSTPTLIKIYGNGFTLKPFNQLPAEWKSFFFDEEDCMKANEKLKIFFETKNIAWPHTESKYKMFISAFQQMQQKFK